jgi:hypothetical protein
MVVRIIAFAWENEAFGKEFDSRCGSALLKYSIPPGRIGPVINQ